MSERFARISGRRNRKTDGKSSSGWMRAATRARAVWAGFLSCLGAACAGLTGHEQARGGAVGPSRCGDTVVTLYLLATCLVSVNYCKQWSRRADSNRGPADYESAALPAELRRLLAGAKHIILARVCVAGLQDTSTERALVLVAKTVTGTPSLDATIRRSQAPVPPASVVAGGRTPNRISVSLVSRTHRP